MARRIADGLLLALAAYVVVSAVSQLWARTGQEFSCDELAITAVAKALGSHAMRAEAMESVTCGWLSLVVLAGIVAQGLTGAW